MLKMTFLELTRDTHELLELYEAGAFTEEELYHQMRHVVVRMRNSLVSDQEQPSYPSLYSPNEDSSSRLPNARIQEERQVSQTDSMDTLARYREIMAQNSHRKNLMKTLDVQEFKEFLGNGKK